MDGLKGQARALTICARVVGFSFSLVGFFFVLSAVVFGRRLRRITVGRNEELSIASPVRNDGKISGPLLDDVQAEGLTPLELKEVLTRELAEYITAPDVTVIVLQMNSRFVSVLGGAKQEARVPLTRDLRVLEAIAQVGGFDVFAQKSDVRIIRRGADGTESEYGFDYDAYIKGNAPGTNIILQTGDTIIIPE